MRVDGRFITFLILLACLSFTGKVTTATSGRASGTVSPTKSLAVEDQMLQPVDLFHDFPEIRWGMSWQEAKQAIEKMGAHPVAFKNTRTELAWDGAFDGMNGRGTVLFKESGEIYEIAVIVHALDKREEVFEQLRLKIVKKHGVATEEKDTSIDTSKVWRLKNGFIIELRLIKDDDSPVIDIHWVKT